MARTIRRISKDNRVQQRPERSKAARLCGSGSTRRYERVKYPRDDHSTSVTLGGENIHGSPWLYLGSDLVKEIRLEGLGCLQLAVRTRAVSPQSSRGGTGWGHDNRAHGRVRARARISYGLYRRWRAISIESDGRSKLCVVDLLRSQAFPVRERCLYVIGWIRCKTVTILLSTGITCIFFAPNWELSNITCQRCLRHSDIHLQLFIRRVEAVLMPPAVSASFLLLKRK